MVALPVVVDNRRRAARSLGRPMQIGNSSPSNDAVITRIRP
jgi:hypothetical protein